MALAAGTDDDFRKGLGGGEIERNDALAEQGRDLFLEGKARALRRLPAGRFSTPN
jgi:hypothetical protein